MSPLEAVGVALGAILAVYVVVRVASAAYFKSKAQFERNDDGTQKPAR